jgi:AraC-like DNA-binding protein
MCFPRYHSGTTPAEVVTPWRLAHLTRLRRVRDRIGADQASPLEVDVLARGTPMSPGYLSREFERAYGQTPHEYLITRRDDHRRQR